MKKIVKIIAVSSLAIALSACQSNKNPNPPPAPVAVAAETAAKAYGMGEKGGLTGEDVEGGGMNGVAHVNSLAPGSNQVYYFRFDQSTVSASDLRAITAQGEYLLANKNAQVRLEGNADDRGSREYNIGLGWRRAQAVAAILKQQGVLAGQIKMVSYGKEHPAVSGENEKAWALNRRVELIYVRK